MIILILLSLAVFLPYLFLHQQKFGKLPAGKRRAQIKKSPNFKDGKFKNLTHTPGLTEGVSYYAVLKEFLAGKNKQRKPPGILPSAKTNLLSLAKEDNILVWFGHSSYFIQAEGKKILVDPVLSGAASPVRSTTRSFPGTDIYTAEEIPDIDYLLISHDHWDHLDYETIRRLRPRVKKVICGLGTAQHLERWGFENEQLVEKDWDGMVVPDEGFVINITTARHFSGRGLKRDTALWVSFVLTTPTRKLFIGGDSGYDIHFAAIGNRFGPFDLAILECGQYDKSWKYIHMMPEEVVRAAGELKANYLLPVHWGKFALANHAWDDPIKRVVAAAEIARQPIFTPMIGQKVNLDKPVNYSAWWEQVN